MQEMHVWNPRLDLGDAAVDGEHHLQIAMVGALSQAIEQSRPWMAQKLADQLAGYSAAHFEGEQLLMDSCGYKRAAEHRQQHESLLAHIKEVQYLLGTGEHDLALPMVLDLLTELGSHIATADRAFLADAGVRRAEAAAR